MSEHEGWGGARKGAGRPKGMTKQEGTRKQRQLRAYDAEWELIKKFASLAKEDIDKATRAVHELASH